MVGSTYRSKILACPRYIRLDTIDGLMLVPLSVNDCMTREVETIATDATAQKIATKLMTTGVRTLVVCEEGEPVGVVSESNLTRLVADQADLDAVTVTEFVSDEFVTISPEVSVERAAELCMEHDTRQLPVVENGELIGIVTTSDLADYLPRLSERRRRADTFRPTDQRRPATNPEMAYNHHDWEFESHGTENGLDVGDVVRFRKKLSDEDIRMFAEISGDTNRLHLDGEFAAGTRFGERIVHGVLATGLISAALARLPGLTVYLSQDLRFLGPLPVDEAATAVCRICQDIGGNRYRLDVTVYNEEGERVIDGESVVLIDDLPKDVEHAAKPVA